MISTCANPSCGTEFHYLRGGRLYRFDLRRPNQPCADVPNAICDSKPSQASVYFWLCGECARKYALRFSSRQGVSVFPLANIPEHRSAVVADIVDAE